MILSHSLNSELIASVGLKALVYSSRTGYPRDMQGKDLSTVKIWTDFESISPEALCPSVESIL